MKFYIYSAIGGSGSTYLINKLNKLFVVCNKPDMFFNPLIKKLNVPIGNWSERFHGFVPRQQCQLFSIKSWEKIFPQFITYLKNKKYVSVFGLSAENRLFSKYQIDNVIFQVRHPLHAYASFAKPERHKDVVDFYGGVNSPDSINYYANRWKNVCDEYLSLREKGLNVHLLRYEFIQKDIKDIDDNPELSWIYENFDSSRRNHGIISQASEDLIKKIVFETYTKIYECWDI